MSEHTIESITQTVANTRDEYETVVRSLSDEQLQAWAFGDPESWTVRQLLAHIAGSGVFLDRAIRRAQGETLPPVNPDEINAVEVAKREGASVDALLAEHRSDVDGFIERVRALDPSDLTRELQLGPQQATAADLLLTLGSRHVGDHIQDIRRATGHAGSAVDA